MAEIFDAVVIGAGAAGLMCARTAGYRGRRVLVLDHANMAGKKILMSGGGRCNFTHLHTTPQHYLSSNPGFCISALKRYTPQQFLELAERHGVDWCEKAPGQLFCVDSSRPILDLLLAECEWAGVTLRLRTAISAVERRGEGFILQTSRGTVQCGSLVVATGGLSIPTLGATGFGYQLAEQFGLTVLPTRAGLVPFTLQPALRDLLAPLSGVATPVTVSCRGQSFSEPMLITHRGLSGPAMLQISSYWQPGDALVLDWLPQSAPDRGTLQAWRARKPGSRLESWLHPPLPRRLAQCLSQLHGWDAPLQHFGQGDLDRVLVQLRQWPLRPSGTEGYRTAEVTLGGVDTRALCQKSFMVRDVPGLFFIGEVLDVTGHLGGHNFQWAWSSGHAAGAAA